MKKRVLLLVLLSFILTGVVSAASLWGSYKGNAIIKVNIDGKQYTTKGVPPVSLNGQVMLPLNVLKSLGVNYTYDSKKQTATIDIPRQPDPQPVIQSSSSGFNISDISRDMKKVNVEFVEYVSDGKGFNSLTFYYDYTLDYLLNKSTVDVFSVVYPASLTTDATLTKIVDIDGNSISITNSAIRDVNAGRITHEQFSKEYKFDGPMFKNSPTSSPEPAVTPSPSPTPEPTATPTPDNVAACQAIRNDYAGRIAMLAYGPKNDPGHVQAYTLQLEHARDQALSEAGC